MRNVIKVNNFSYYLFYFKWWIYEFFLILVLLLVYGNNPLLYVKNILRFGKFICFESYKNTSNSNLHENELIKLYKFSNKTWNNYKLPWECVGIYTFVITWTCGTQSTSLVLIVFYYIFVDILHKLSNRTQFNYHRSLIQEQFN